MKCNISVQTEVTLKNIRYEFHVVPHTEKNCFEKINIICHIRNVMKTSKMRHIEGKIKQTGFGLNFLLQKN